LLATPNVEDVKSVHDSSASENEKNSYGVHSFYF